MTDTPIPPALTAEQWAEAVSSTDLPPDTDAVEWSRLGLSHAAKGGIDGGIYIEEYDEKSCASVHVHPRARHALAALCLYGQPFGFTPQDVEALLYTLDDAGKCGTDENLASIAARIQALLPPQPQIVAPTASQGPA